MRDGSPLQCRNRLKDGWDAPALQTLFFVVLDAYGVLCYSSDTDPHLNGSTSMRALFFFSATLSCFVKSLKPARESEDYRKIKCFEVYDNPRFNTRVETDEISNPFSNFRRQFQFGEVLLRQTRLKKVQTTTGYRIFAAVFVLNCKKRFGLKRHRRRFYVNHFLSLY